MRSSPLWITPLALVFLLTACNAEAVSQDPPPPVNIPSEEVIEERIETEEEAIRLVRVVGGLENPWGLAFLPDGGMLVTERPGRMNLVRNGEITRVTGLPEVRAQGQGGLLDVVLHPDYATNGWIYFTYSAPGEGGIGTALSRARLDGTSLVDVETLYSMERKTDRGHHFGSRIAFPGDGTVVFTIGDRGEPDRAQDPMDPAGSTIRISEDGGIPQDNPFVDRDDALPEIYSIGNRNSQGMAIHPQTGAIWQTEHGPRGGDEINVIRPGENYGWPEASYGVDYRTREPIGEERVPGMAEPLEVWTPSIAPSGTMFYTGDAFPNWRGDLFVGALAHQQVRRVVLDGQNVTHQETLIQGTIGRIRYVTQGPDGNIYLLTDLSEGGIYRMEPADEMAATE